jgi:quinol monooxygenase YgiN
MSEHVSFLLSLSINPGQFENLKTLVTEMVETNQKNEVGTLIFEWAISEDRQMCDIYERYRDSAAVMKHVESFGANFATRFLEALTLTRFVVYGTPSEQVKDTLAAWKPIYMAPFGGFSR